MSSQLYDTAVAAHPNIPTDAAQGKFDALLVWLRANVQQQGKKYLPNELLTRATGQPLTAKPYLAYLKRKYSKLYNLS